MGQITTNVKKHNIPKNYKGMITNFLAWIKENIIFISEWKGEFMRMGTIIKDDSIYGKSKTKKYWNW